MTISNTTTAFFCGVFWQMALNSLIQDWYGRESYAEHVLNHWTPSYISVPLAALVFVLTLFYKERLLSKEISKEGRDRI